MRERHILTCSERFTGGGRGHMCALLIPGEIGFRRRETPLAKGGTLGKGVEGKAEGGGRGDKSNKSPLMQQRHERVGALRKQVA